MLLPENIGPMMSWSWPLDAKGDSVRGAVEVVVVVVVEVVEVVSMTCFVSA